MKKKVYRYEFIGKNTKITKSNNESIVGLEGKVIDETKHTFVILTSKGRKRVMKKGNVFEFRFDGKKTPIEGDLINISPEERIKIK